MLAPPGSWRPLLGEILDTLLLFNWMNATEKDFQDRFLGCECHNAHIQCFEDVVYTQMAAVISTKSMAVYSNCVIEYFTTSDSARSEALLPAFTGISDQCRISQV